MRGIRTRNFNRRATKAGLDEEDLTELIRALVERPDLGAVISGTGGARKVRLRLPGRGKRGGARVIYAIDTCFARRLRQERTGKSLSRGAQGHRRSHSRNRNRLES